MRVAVGCDHAGFPLKDTVIEQLQSLGHEVIDCGTHSTEAVDYPDFAQAVAEKVSGGEAARGIVLCGSGVGATVAANKVVGVRACLCHDTYSAHQGVEHDDLNVLCLGARVIGPELAREIVRAFVGAQFSGEERHRRRLNKVLEMEKKYAGEA
ncbi:MAG: ribose 5-phosphate isomerase B [Abditibacteriales bacterium]|nr:ribose 5-phosphate isomerase B [Abditibacteriales bacterium]MDW8365873.1 ribose 5-phosphate isomerase B [Abditibacteriales bacterium]